MAFVGAFILAISLPCMVLVVLLRRLYEYNRALKDGTVRTICPNCHRHVKLSMFLCPCGRPVELTPDEKEPYWRRCECGRLLPKTNKKGRNNLVAVCPSCGWTLGINAGMNRELIVPLVGGPSTGKSAFLAALVYVAAYQLPQKRGITVSFPFPEDARFVENCRREWMLGQRPDKTSNMTPNGFGMDLLNQRTNETVRFYCYDPAGESFDDERSLGQFQYYDYMDGVFFLIDPFAIPSVRRKYAHELGGAGTQGFQASDRDLNDYCDRFINSLKDYHGLGCDEYHFASCAIVITKADMFDLGKRIGDRGARNIMRNHPEMKYDEALHTACVRFLEDAGVGDIIAKLEDHFAEVRCFSVSAFGHMPDTGGAFEPKRIDAPFRWLLAQAAPRRTIGTWLSDFISGD